MAHPYNELRSHKVQRKRVSPITGGLASAAVPGLPQAPKAAGLAAPEVPLRADGGAVSARADRVARKSGGRVGKTNINIIVAPKSGDAPAMAAAPPMMPPKPPMAPPGPPAPAMGVPGLGGMPPMPPGAPPRSEGGRAYKKGGAVRAKSDASVQGPLGTGIGDRTPIQHSGNKSDTQNIGRKPVITKAAGGAIYADGRKGKQMAWLEGVGAGGGKGRLKKAHHRNKA